jgi:threonine synthase
MTPLYDSARVAEQLGLKRVWVKDDGQNPTGSFKDRASAMVVARAMEAGIRVVSTASTGNAAAALAGIGASVGMDTIIFVPASAPEAKIAQLLVYGATVLLVEDTYDVAFDLCYQMCLEEGWYCRNTAMNPYTTEGKKTAAYEIAEQLDWIVPDVVLVGVGDGNIIAGIHKGFFDLLELGWIERIPRLIGVQAEGSSALFSAWKNGIAAQDMQPQPANTIADSISAGLPRDRAKALRAVRETSGAFVSVSDREILVAIPAFARLTGIFVEPSCAAVYAGAERAVQSGLIHEDESTVLLMTGNGLKDVPRAQQSVGQGLRVKSNLDSVRRALQNR